jgi:hypothetical protein
MITKPNWPALPFDAWKQTCDTLHMYLQIAGKLRMALAPPEPEYAQVTLYPTARGLTTGPMHQGGRAFQCDFDFIAHRCELDANDGRSRSIDLAGKNVATFYADFTSALADLGIDAHINTQPQEFPNPIPFDKDRVHSTYDREWANRFWTVLTLVDAAFREHRAPYRGRHTPVHLFWGSLDLSYSRYSGRPADPPRNANAMMRNSMDAQEVCAGFWPGNDAFPEPAFYCYGYPKPDGIEKAQVEPAGAQWSDKLGEFVVRYEDVRNTPSAHDAIRRFLFTTFNAIATRGNWDNTLTSVS